VSAAPEAVSLELSEHAVERWHERVRPGLSFEAAEDDLVRRLEEHGRFGPRPEWPGDEYGYAADRWLWLGEDIVFPVYRELVVTCLIRSAYTIHGRRIATNENGFARRARRRKEDPGRRKAEGRAAKSNRVRDRSWREEA